MLGPRQDGDVVMYFTFESKVLPERDVCRHSVVDDVVSVDKKEKHILMLRGHRRGQSQGQVDMGRRKS